MSTSARAAFTAAIMLACIGPVSGYDIPEAVYPELPKAAASAELFVPAGWGIEVQENGDLNKDGRDDLLLVLKGEDPGNLIANDPDSPGLHEWDANPRILAVAFALKKGGYELVLQSDDFLPRYENPCIDDPFAAAEIADGAIRIWLHYWANAGSWYTASPCFTFRWSGKAFRLVSYTNYTTKRNTGLTWDLSLDYAARKAEISVGSFSDDETKDTTRAKKLPRAPLRTIEEIGAGWDFYPAQLDLGWWGLGELD